MFNPSFLCRHVSSFQTGSRYNEMLLSYYSVMKPSDSMLKFRLKTEGKVSYSILFYSFVVQRMSLMFQMINVPAGRQHNY